jgi:hypothetical protein
VLRDCHRHGLETRWTIATGVELWSLAVLLLLVLRASSRLVEHFHERHYQPAVDRSAGMRRRVDDRPLAWWAVKRVSQYSGRINLWLAGGFGVPCALYTVAGPLWPGWLSKGVFVLCDGAGGIPAEATFTALRPTGRAPWGASTRSSSERWRWPSAASP